MRWPASAAVAVWLAVATVQAWVSDQLPSSANDVREEGLLILDAWAMDNASGITVTVPARELAQFMRPR